MRNSRAEGREIRSPISTLICGTAALGYLCLLLSACSAGEAENVARAGARAAPVVRDSGGVRIVENSGPRWRSDEAWRLSQRPTLEILGAGSDPDAVLLDPRSVYRTDDGRYIVADGMFAGHNEVLVFDRRGRYRLSMGGEGPGPCEFGQLWWAAPYRGDSIAAHDYANHTMVIFSADGRCGREVRLPTWRPPQAPGTYGYADGAEAVYPDGSFLTYPGGYVDVSGGRGPVWYRHALLRVSPKGVVTDSLGVFGIFQSWWTGREQKLYPFAAIGARSLHGETLYYGTGESFEVRIYDRKGTLRTAVRRAHRPQELTATDRQAFRTWYLERVARSPEGGSAAAERAEAMLADLEFPPDQPAFSAILVDAEGNLWVEKYRWPDPLSIPPEPRPVQWSVFDSEGTWLGNVEVPGRLLLQSIGEDHVIGFWKDAYDVTHIRVYDLIKP